MGDTATIQNQFTNVKGIYILKLEYLASIQRHLFLVNASLLKTILFSLSCNIRLVLNSLA